MLNKISNENLKLGVSTSISPITPYNITILLIIQNYLKNKHKYNTLTKNTEIFKRHYTLKLLHLIEETNMTLYQTISVIEEIHVEIGKDVLKCLDDICTKNQTLLLYKFLANLQSFLVDLNFIIPRSSIICLYMRNILLKFDQYWFQDVAKLLKSLCHYYFQYKKGDENDSITNKSVESNNHLDLLLACRNNDYNNAINYVRRYFEAQMTLPFINFNDDKEIKRDDYFHYEDYIKAFCAGAYNIAILQQRFGYDELSSHHLREALQIVYSTRDEGMLDRCQTFLQASKLTVPLTREKYFHNVEIDPSSFIFRQQDLVNIQNGPQNDVQEISSKEKIKSKNLKDPCCYSENSHILKASALRARYLVEQRGDPQTIMEMLLYSPEKGCDSSRAISIKTKLAYTEEELAVERASRQLLASALGQVYGVWAECCQLLSQQTLHLCEPVQSGPLIGGIEMVNSLALCNQARYHHCKGNYQVRDAIAKLLGLDVKTGSSKAQNSKFDDPIKIAFLEMFIEQAIFSGCGERRNTKNLLEQLRPLDSQISAYWEAEYFYRVLRDSLTALDLLKPFYEECESVTYEPRTTLTNVQYQYLRTKCMMLAAHILSSTGQRTQALAYLIKGLGVCYKFNLHQMATLTLFHIAGIKLRLGGRSNVTEAFVLSNLTRAYMTSSCLGSLRAKDIQQTYYDIERAYEKELNPSL